jgi:hypothetical protein
LAINSLFAQTLKGSLFNQEDSLPAMFVNVVQVDSFGKLLTGTTTDEKGEFLVTVLKNTEMIRIVQLPEFAEIQVINISHDLVDTLDLEKIPMIKAPNYPQVQSKGISKRKERRNQRQLIKAYNKKVKAYKNRDLEINGQAVGLTATYHQPKDTERPRLIYILNLNEIKN